MLEKIRKLKTSVKPKKTLKHNKEQYIVALDVGTEFIKALVARADQKQISVIGVGRVRQSLSDMQAGAISDIGSVVANCDRALSIAEQQAGVSVRTAVIGIAGELVRGTTTTVRVKRKQADKPLDISEVERIITLVQDRAESKAREQLSKEMGGKPIEIKLVNSALVDITIDGYTVTNPVGFQGKEVVIQLYTAFAPLIHIGALERVAQELDLDLLAVAAEPFAVARSVIGDDPNAKISAVLMDVGGGTTDIAVVNEGGVQGTKMFGIGGRSFTKSIERATGLNFQQAEALKLAIGTDKIPHSKEKIAKDAIKSTLDVWINGVELALSEFSNLDSLPSKLLLCGGGSSLDQLVETLEKSDWYKNSPFTRRPDIQHIHPSEVVGIIDKTDAVTDHTFVTALGLLRVGNDTIEYDGDKQGSSIKQRIDRILRV